MASTTPACPPRSPSRAGRRRGSSTSRSCATSWSRRARARSRSSSARRAAAPRWPRRPRPPVTITEVDLGGLIKFAVDKYSVPEGGSSVTLTVVRTGGAAGGRVGGLRHPRRHRGQRRRGRLLAPVRHPHASPAATPRPPSPFPSARTRWPEGHESFTVELRNPRGGATLPVPPAPGRVATVTIVDDDTLVQFSGRFMGNSPEVVRTGQMGSRVTVNYQAISEHGDLRRRFPADGRHAHLRPGRAIAAGPAGHRQGHHRRGPETFTIQLSDPQPVGRAQARPRRGQDVHDRRRRVRRHQRPLRRSRVLRRRGPDGHADRAARRRPRHDADRELEGASAATRWPASTSRPPRAR